MKRSKATAPGKGRSEAAGKGLRRVVPWGRHPRVSVEPGLGQRARQRLSTLRERAPSGEQLRAQFKGLRAWTERSVESQPLALGLGAVALGFGAAALFPATRLERRAYDQALGAARQLDAVVDKAGELAEKAGELAEKSWRAPTSAPPAA